MQEVDLPCDGCGVMVSEPILTPYDYPLSLAAGTTHYRQPHEYHDALLRQWSMHTYLCDACAVASNPRHNHPSLFWKRES